MHPSSAPTTPTRTRRRSIGTIFSAASFSTPPRSIEYNYNNRFPSPPPLISRNGQVSRHHIPPAATSESDTNSSSGSNRATARSRSSTTERFNLEACLALLRFDDAPSHHQMTPTRRVVDDTEMTDERKDDEDEEVADINSPPLLFRRSGIDINAPHRSPAPTSSTSQGLSNPYQLRRVSLTPESNK